MTSRQKWKFTLPLLCLFIPITVRAEMLPFSAPPARLNKVTFQMTAEQWVTTKTAKITIGVDATLNENQLSKVRTDILTKLGKLAPGAEWHITIFDRSQDNSGLEKLHIEAQARVAEAGLSDLRAQAKTMSKPGETYTVLNVEYIPTISEIEATEAALRAKVYESAKNELATINKVYPEQKYYLHSVDFSGATPPPQPLVASARMSLAKVATTVASPVLVISNNVVVTANVVLASNIPDKKDTE